MGVKRVLFLDDRSDRIESAIRRFAPPEHQLTCVFTAKECLDKLSRNEYDEVWLDYDLEFSHYEIGKPSGMDVVEYICVHDWPIGFKKPEFVIHSINKFGAETMGQQLYKSDFKYRIDPWRYPYYYNSIVTGAFDVIHPEYIRLFKEAKRISSFLTVALNANKPNQVLSADEREEILWSIRYVDNVVRYHSEEELTEILTNLKRESQNRLIRVSGDDHKGKSTREHLKIDYHYKEYGEWSATKIKKLYGESVND